MPPATGIFFSFSAAKNPTCVLSGDQNGMCAFSVPSSALAVSASSGRTHNRVVPLGSAVVKTSVRPSGEMAESAASKYSVAPSGPSTVTREASRAGVDRCRRGDEKSDRRDQRARGGRAYQRDERSARPASRRRFGRHPCRSVQDGRRSALMRWGSFSRHRRSNRRSPAGRLAGAATSSILLHHRGHHRIRFACEDLLAGERFEHDAKGPNQRAGRRPCPWPLRDM